MNADPPTKFRSIEVPIADVSPPATNARFIGNPATVKAMAERMKAVGVLQAPTAREVPPGAGKYELVFGARRLQAAKLAGLKTFPIVPRELTDQEAAEKGATT